MAELNRLRELAALLKPAPVSESQRIEYLRKVIYEAIFNENIDPEAVAPLVEEFATRLQKLEARK